MHRVLRNLKCLNIFNIEETSLLWLNEIIPICFFFSAFFPIYFYYLEANYFTILQRFLSYIDMNQPWIYMYSPF